MLNLNNSLNEYLFPTKNKERKKLLIIKAAITKFEKCYLLSNNIFFLN